MEAYDIANLPALQRKDRPEPSSQRCDVDGPQADDEGAGEDIDA